MHCDDGSRIVVISHFDAIMAQILQPIGQKRLTNVAVVRYKIKGKRYAKIRSKFFVWSFEYSSSEFSLNWRVLQF